MQAVDGTRSEDLHYSTVIGISRKDAEELRRLQLELLQKAEKIIRDSPEEAAYVVLMDLFEL